jgi:hypothetical protein
MAADHRLRRRIVFGIIAGLVVGGVVAWGVAVWWAWATGLSWARSFGYTAAPMVPLATVSGWSIARLNDRRLPR